MNNFIKLKARIKKLCVVRDLLVVVLEVEKVFGKLGEMPYEPLEEE
jgi:hypothetical protein